MTSSGVKLCRHCGEWKSISDYHKNKQTKDGKSSYCKPCASERAAKWKSDNSDKAKDTDLQRKYGISLADQLWLYSEQNGCCAICGVEEGSAPRGTLFVDHDHVTGKVRGLLCHHCNSGLGHFMDNVNFLFEAQKYLLKIQEERGCSPP